MSGRCRGSWRGEQEWREYGLRIGMECEGGEYGLRVGMEG